MEMFWDRVSRIKHSENFLFGAKSKEVEIAKLNYLEGYGIK